MRKKPFEIFKELFPVLFMAVIIPVLLNFFLELAGLGMDSFLVPKDPMAEMDPNSLGPASFLPTLNFSLLGIGTLLAQGIHLLVSTFLAGGASLAIYRRVKYDSEIKMEDIFYFFGQKPVFNFATFFLSGILIGVAFLFLIIPGIIVSVGLFTLPVVLAISQEENRGRGPLQIIKDTWATTKGHKGMIFGKLFVFSIVLGIIGAAINFFVGMAFGAEAMLDQTSTVNLVFIPLLTTVTSLITSLVMFIPEIDIYQELVANRVFEPAMEENQIEEDLAHMEEDQVRVPENFREDQDSLDE